MSNEVVIESSVVELNPAIIDDSSLQTRSNIESGLDSLVASISQLGQLQPVVVVASGDSRYRCIMGHRRVAACKQLGISVKAIIQDGLDDHNDALKTMTENVVRSDLTPLELAHSYQLMMEVHGVSQAELARQLQVSRSSINKSLALLKAPEYIVKLDASGLTQGSNILYELAVLAEQYPEPVQQFCDTHLTSGSSITYQDAVELKQSLMALQTMTVTEAMDDTPSQRISEVLDLPSEQRVLDDIKGSEFSQPDSDAFSLEHDTDGFDDDVAFSVDQTPVKPKSAKLDVAVVYKRRTYKLDLKRPLSEEGSVNLLDAEGQQHLAEVDKLKIKAVADPSSILSVLSKTSGVS